MSPQTSSSSVQKDSGYANQEFTYFQGDFVPASEAKISVKTNGFLYGTSVFEGIRGYYLKENNSISVFRLREHYERMAANAKMFYLMPDTLDVSKMVDITVELIEKSKPTQDIYIRPTLYKDTDLITPSLTQAPSEFCVWTKPMGDYLDTTKALNVCISNWRRLSDNMIPPRAKAGGAYMNTALAVSDARLSGFDDAIFLTDSGHVSEGSAMNLFIVKDGVLHTPDVRQNILPGITRSTIMEIAKQNLRIESVEREIDRTELYCADEVFFCGTGAQVVPVGAIDHRPIGNGQIGEITKQIQSLYFEVVKNRHLPYTSWCTIVKL